MEATIQVEGTDDMKIDMNIEMNNNINNVKKITKITHRSLMSPICGGLMNKKPWTQGDDHEDQEPEEPAKPVRRRKAALWSCFLRVGHGGIP